MLTPEEPLSSVAYVYDGSPEGLLTAVFQAYANHEDPQDVVREGALQPRLGAVRAVRGDGRRSGRARAKRRAPHLRAGRPRRDRARLPVGRPCRRHRRLPLRAPRHAHRPRARRPRAPRRRPAFRAGPRGHERTALPPAVFAVRASEGRRMVRPLPPQSVGGPFAHGLVQRALQHAAVHDLRRGPRPCRRPTRGAAGIWSAPSPSRFPPPPTTRRSCRRPGSASTTPWPWRRATTPSCAASSCPSASGKDILEMHERIPSRKLAR